MWIIVTLAIQQLPIWSAQTFAHQEQPHELGKECKGVLCSMAVKTVFWETELEYSKCTLFLCISPKSHSRSRLQGSELVARCVILNVIDLYHVVRLVLKLDTWLPPGVTGIGVENDGVGVERVGGPEVGVLDVATIKCCKSRLYQGDGLFITNFRYVVRWRLIGNCMYWGKVES